MKKTSKKIIGWLLALSLCAAAALPAFAAEDGVTAPALLAAGNGEEGTTAAAEDVDGDGEMTAADARAAVLAKIGDARDAKSIAGALPAARAILRASAGIAPENPTALDLAGIGLSDRVITVGDMGVTAAELIYLYNSVYSYYYNQAYQMDSNYGEGMGKAMMGFDYTVSPAQQFTTDDKGNKITYSEFFGKTAIEAFEQTAYFCSLAKDSGITLSDEETQALEENAASFARTAESYGMTADEFAEQQFGAGINMYVLMKSTLDQMLAESFKTKMAEDAAKALTDDELEAYYDEHTEDFTTVSFRMLQLALKVADDGSNDLEKKQAQADGFVAAVKSEDAFIAEAKKLDPEAFADTDKTKIDGVKYGALNQYISADAAKWCFDEARKTGDIASFATENYVYIIYITQPAARDENLLPSVRHLLVTFAANYTPEDGATAVDGDNYRGLQQGRQNRRELRRTGEQIQRGYRVHHRRQRRRRPLRRRCEGAVRRAL